MLFHSSCQQGGTLTITTSSPLANGTVNQLYGQSVQATGGLPPYTWSLASGTLPPGMTFTTQGVVGGNAVGLVSGIPTATGTFNLTIQVTDSASPPNTATKAFALTISQAPPLTITTTSPLPGGTVSQPYGPLQLQASGGTTPYSWSVTSGALPANLTLNSAGVLSGTPTTAGTSNFTIQVTDSSNPAQMASQAFSLTVAPAPPKLTITTSSPLPGGTVNQAYGPVQLQATGGTTPYSWSVISGSLPPNLTLTSAGVLSGTPTTSGTSNFTIQVKDSSNPAQMASQAFALTINAAKTYSQSQIFNSGFLIALDDNARIAVVGNNPLFGGLASAMVFLNDGMGNWSPATTLMNGDNDVASVAISSDGNTIVVGSCQNQGCIGNAFVYVVSNGAWPSGNMNPTATLSVSNAGSGPGEVGYSVAVDQNGQTIVVGAPGDLTQNGPGEAAVFVMPQGGWKSNHEDALLSVTSQDVGVGISVAIDATGDTVVAGATGLGVAVNPGFAYVYVRPGGGWATTNTPNATLSHTSAMNNDDFGLSVAISADGKTVVSGAPNVSGSGAAYVFFNASAPNGWASKTEDATLTASNGQSNDIFAETTTITDNGATIVVGAPGLPGSTAGAAYVFAVPAGGWSGPQNETQALAASAGTAINGQSVVPSSGFGRGLSISGDATTIGVGGFATLGGMAGQGVVYLFQ